MMSPDVLVLNRKPTSGCNMPRVAHFKTKTKEPRCFTSIEAAECFTLEPCMHTHAQQASQCKWRGLLEMKDSLTSPLVRDHCPPFCYSVLWSCGKQMTSESQHCAQVGKKRKGEGRQCCGRASVRTVLSSNAIPTVPSLRAAWGCFSGLQALLQQPEQQQNWNLSWESKASSSSSIRGSPTWLFPPALWLKVCSRSPAFHLFLFI